MKVSLLLFTWLFYSVAFALVPIKGIVKGEVEDVVQYDPLTSIFSEQFNSSDAGLKEKQRLKDFTVIQQSGKKIVPKEALLGLCNILVWITAQRP